MPKHSEHVDDPEYWRSKASATRTLAAKTKHQSARKVLEDVAASYERLADLAEQQRKEKRADTR